MIIKKICVREMPIILTEVNGSSTVLNNLRSSVKPIEFFFQHVTILVDHMATQRQKFLSILSHIELLKEVVFTVDFIDLLTC